MVTVLLMLAIAATGQRTGTPVEADASAKTVKATGSVTARALKDRFADVVNVKDFGAKGDGVTDDTAAIQAAINAAVRGQEVVFPAQGDYGAGKFYKTTSTITVSTTGITLVGSGTDNGGYDTVIKNTTSGPMFRTTAGEFAMHHIMLIGNGSGRGAGATVAGLDLRGDASGNMDSTIRFCDFEGVSYATSTAGRNLVFKDNIIGDSLEGIKINAATSGETRGFVVEGNRFHSIGNTDGAGNYRVIDASNGAQQIIVKDNYRDAGGYAMFFSADYAVSTVTIDNNVIVRSENTAISIATVQDLSVRNNTIVFDTPWATYDPYAPSAYSIALGTVTRGTISGNQVVHGPRHGIWISQASSGLNISGNVIHNAGSKTANTYDGIILDSSSTVDAVIAGNVVSADAATYHRNGINVPTTTSIVVAGNQVRYSATADYSGISTSSLDTMASSVAISSFGANVASNTSPNVAMTYLSRDGAVTMSGLVHSTSGTITAGTTLFTIDASYRPNRAIIVPVLTDGGTAGYLLINTNGTCSASFNLVNGSVQLGLDGFSYRKTN